ncbi:MAG TPA: carbohydrate kinase [Acidobacteriaceae bacterium]|jgi:fructokinase
MSASKSIVGLGELLWDMLPQGPQLGGAPSNFAVMAARLGNKGAIATRIGTDPLGREAMAYLKTTPVDTGYIQEDFSRVTGTVTVALEKGEPRFTIHEPVAWDFLELTPHWLALAEQADAVCFGTLAQRSPASRRTIESFLHETRPECLRIFDVNLRPPFFSAEIVERSLELATIFKLNADEMPQVLSLLEFPEAAGTTPDFLLNGARQIIDQFPVKLVAITLGAQGSLLVTRNEVDRHAGYPVKVVDAVGAGDAFTAALTHYYLRGAPLSQLNAAGNRWGAWVASRAGAMPALPDTEREAVMNQIAHAS